MYQDHKDSLNGPQREAVTTTQGPVLVLAGAGSGKTRVITHRIVELIHQGIDPRNILAVTFTNKAAKEMRDRVLALIQKYPGSSMASRDGVPTVTTFHALGVRILREHHQTLNLPRHFIIFDRSDSIRAIKKALELSGNDPKQFEPRAMRSMSSNAKGAARFLSEYTQEASTYPQRVASAVWEHYEAILREEHALDFDDLLVRTLRLLQDTPVIKEVLQRRYL